MRGGDSARAVPRLAGGVGRVGRRGSAERLGAGDRSGRNLDKVLFGKTLRLSGGFVVGFFGRRFRAVRFRFGAVKRLGNNCRQQGTAQGSRGTGPMAARVDGSIARRRREGSVNRRSG